MTNIARYAIVQQRIMWPSAAYFSSNTARLWRKKSYNHFVVNDQNDQNDENQDSSETNQTDFVLTGASSERRFGNDFVLVDYHNFSGFILIKTPQQMQLALRPSHDETAICPITGRTLLNIRPQSNLLKLTSKTDTRPHLHHINAGLVNQ